jgi:hypothetical protein
MKRIVDRYTFTPGTANNGKLVLTDFTSIVLSRILLITNTTSNKIIYNFAAAGATVSGNTITFNTDTSSMSSSDILQIYYDYPEATNDDLLWALNRIVAALPLLNSLGYTRVALDTSSTVTTNTSITTTNSGGYNYVYQPFNEMNNNWSTQIRPRILSN